MNSLPIAPSPISASVLVVGRGAPLPFGASTVQGGVNFSVISRITPRRSRSCFSTGAEGRRFTKCRSIQHCTEPATSGTSSSPMSASALEYGFRLNGPRGVGHAFDPRLIMLDPVRSGDCRRRRMGAAGSGWQASPRHGRGFRVGQRSAAEDAALRHGHLRAARPRIHPRPFVRRAQSRDVRGSGGEDSLSQGSGNHGGAAHADRGVRRTGHAAVRKPGRHRHIRQRVGLPSARVLCAQSLVRRAEPSRRSGARVQAAGARLPRRRDRSHSRCRVQSHRRRRDGGTDVVVSRHRQHHLLHDGSAIREPIATTPAAATP